MPKAPYSEWRNGRPRWQPAPLLRARGFRGFDMKDEQGRWLKWDAAQTMAFSFNERVRATAPAARLHPAVGLDLLTAVANSNFLGAKLAPPLRTPIGEYVYIFAMDGRWAKIGFTTNPRKRFDTLAGNMPLPLTALLLSPGTMMDERALHAHFADCRLKNEWFRIAGDLANWLSTVSLAYRRVCKVSRQSQSLTASSQSVQG